MIKNERLATKFLFILFLVITIIPTFTGSSLTHTQSVDCILVHNSQCGSCEDRFNGEVTSFYENFLVRFTYDSNRIEGSSLTHRETAQLLLENIAPNRPLYDVLEAKSHQVLFEEMRRYAATSGDLHFNLILEWHHILFKNSCPDIAGELRTEQVNCYFIKSKIYLKITNIVFRGS